MDRGDFRAFQPHDACASDRFGRQQPSGLAALRAVLPAWVVSRLLVLASLGIASATGGLPQTGTAPHAHGLFVWDGAWYRLIADHGYDAAGRTSARFFPLFPEIGRNGVGLLVLANVAALVFAALTVALVQRQTGNEQAARLTGWLVLLAPGAGVVALPYTEALAGALAVGYFLALTARRPWLAVLCGLASGATRPTGVLLAVAGGVIAWRDRRWLSTIAAIAPVAGTVAWGLWCQATFGDFWLPYRSQNGAHARHGLLNDPLGGLASDYGITLLCLVAAIVLLVLAVRRLPPSWTAWSLVMLVAFLTAPKLQSFPRYASALFPLLAMAAILVAGHRRLSSSVIAGSAALFVAVATLGFAGHVVL